MKIQGMREAKGKALLRFTMPLDRSWLSSVVESVHAAVLDPDTSDGQLSDILRGQLGIKALYCLHRCNGVPEGEVCKLDTWMECRECLPMSIKHKCHGWGLSNDRKQGEGYNEVVVPDTN